MDRLGDEQTQVADILVIGAGMCGSAAARHLKELRPELAVWLVGPDEALGRAAAAFGQHYDEGRITRKVDSNLVWATLAARSMERYAAIEEASGIKFHHPVGFVAIGHAEGPYIRGSSDVAAARGVPLRGPLSAAALRAELPFLALDDENVGLLEEHTGAGLISPRALVQAQCVLFERSGGRIVRDVVERLEYDDAAAHSESDSKRLLCASLRSGGSLLARQALVCTGALTRWKPLLPSGEEHLRLVTSVVTQEVVRIAISRDEDLHALANMPCMVFKFGNAAFGTAATFDSCYVLPPIPYPEENQAEDGARHRDGGQPRPQKHYLKIGHGTWFECNLSNSEEALAWMRGEVAANVRDGVSAAVALQGMLEKILPGLLARASEVIVDRCMWDTTPGMRPYVDMLPGGCIGVCAGGNGFAAKSSDELGRVSALMMLGALDGSGWSYDLPRDAFAAAFETDGKHG